MRTFEVVFFLGVFEDSVLGHPADDLPKWGVTDRLHVALVEEFARPGRVGEGEGQGQRLSCGKGRDGRQVCSGHGVAL